MGSCPTGGNCFVALSLLAIAENIFLGRGKTITAVHSFGNALVPGNADKKFGFANLQEHLQRPSRWQSIVNHPRP
eukprot:8470023-Karenia_brevis.AAC.1